MKTKVFGKISGLVVASAAALGLAWSGLSYAQDVTTITRATVSGKTIEQTGEGETGKGTFKTADAINNLTGQEPGSKPPRNQMLVLLSYCDEPDWLALGVWDKDTDDLVEGSSLACLWTEGPLLVNDKKDTGFTTLDVDAEHFNLNELDMAVLITLGQLSKKVDSERPVCLKKFATLTSSGYYYGDGTPESVTSKPFIIKSNGKPFAELEGDAISPQCD